MFRLTEKDMQRLVSGQKQKLDEMLKSGIPIVYGDDSGNVFMEHPDGTIEDITNSAPVESRLDKLKA